MEKELGMVMIDAMKLVNGDVVLRMQQQPMMR
jgi:hypothetical protein